MKKRTKKTMSLQRTMYDEIVNSLQSYWLVSLIPNKKIRPSRTYDISAGNLRDISREYISLKFYRYHLFPGVVKIKIDDIDDIKRYIKRRKPLTSVKLLDITKSKSAARKEQAIKASLMKWSAFWAIVLVVAALSVGIAFIVK